MKEISTWGFISIILVIIGGINCGFVGLFSIDLISAILGHALGRFFYVLIGLAAVYLIYERFIKSV